MCIAVNNFCCCIPLRTGCFIIGWVQLTLWGCAAITSAIAGLTQIGEDNSAPVSALFISMIVTYAAIKLLLGLHTGMSEAFRVYVVIMTWVIVVQYILLIFTIVMFLIMDLNLSDYWSSLAGIFIVICIEVYFLIVVNSYDNHVYGMDFNI